MDARKIKTREIIRDIKTLDKSKVLTDKIKSSVIHTKDDITDDRISDRERSPDRYADDKLSGLAKDTSRVAIGMAKEKGTRTLIRSIKARSDRAKSKRQNANEEMNREQASPLAIKRKLDRDKAKSRKSGSLAKKAGIGSDNSAKNQFKASKSVEMLNANRSNPNKTAKTGIKSAGRVKRIKTGASKSVKMIIAATRSLMTAIASGGTVAIVVVIIVCMIGFIAVSPMGIFFSNDSGDNKMADLISRLNAEFFEKIEKIKDKNEHDDYILTSTDGTNSINWNEVLAVYAVITVTDPKDATEVVSVDDIKEKKLRKILYDMNEIKHKITKEKEVEKNMEYTVKVLTITIKKKTPQQMITEYMLTKDQQDMLTEILKPSYDELWASLIYGSDGSGEIIAGFGSGQLAWPVPGYSANTSSYGMRKHPITGKISMHNGTDLAAPTGTKIVAAEAGKVTSAGWNSGGYGYFTIIDHGEGLVTRYAHQSRIITKTGAKVKRGQVIGLVGSTGYSTGPHLHFEVLINGQFQNPINYIKDK